jgi:L-seryl-tRNA(Ser) seleniumtransferase
MKIDRQEIVGAVAALKRWMTLNHEERLAMIEQKSHIMAKPLKGIPGVKAEVLTSHFGHQPFGTKITIDPKVAGVTAQQVVDALKAGDPPVWTRAAMDEGETIYLHSFGLNEGEEYTVGERVAEVLKQKARR